MKLNTSISLDDAEINQVESVLFSSKNNLKNSNYLLNLNDRSQSKMDIFLDNVSQSLSNYSDDLSEESSESIEILTPS